MPGVPLRFATDAAAERLWARRALHLLRGAADQGRGQSARIRRASAPPTSSPRRRVLQLYDPDRSRSPRQAGAIGDLGWLPRGAAAPAGARCGRRGGEGLRLLTGRVTSPTLLRLIGAAPDSASRARPGTPTRRSARTNARRGAALAFGRPLDAAAAARPRRGGAVPRRRSARARPRPDPQRPRLRRAAPARAGGRPVSPPLCDRAGDDADRRQCRPPPAAARRTSSATSRLRWRRELGAPAAAARRCREAPAQFLARSRRDLQAQRGAALVLAGEALPPEVHALAHWINAQLAAPGRRDRAAWTAAAGRRRHRSPTLVAATCGRARPIRC